MSSGYLPLWDNDSFGYGTIPDLVKLDMEITRSIIALLVTDSKKNENLLNSIDFPKKRD